MQANPSPPRAEKRPIRLAGRTLKNATHICAFFRSREEQDEVLMPFFKEGYERGEKLFHIVDAGLRADHLQACSQCGIDVEGAQKSGQLEVLAWEQAYLQDGYFDGDRMVRVLREVMDATHQKYPLGRFMGNMEWALTTLPGVTDIVEYECKLNFALREYEDPVICVYDLNRHSAAVVMDILRTHPMVIVGGLLQENPLYVHPEAFLEELKQRKHAH